MNKVRHKKKRQKMRENRVFTETVAQIVIQKGKLCIKFESMPYCSLLCDYQVTQRYKSSTSCYALHRLLCLHCL